jgi:hypothetical protein
MHLDRFQFREPRLFILLLAHDCAPLEHWESPKRRLPRKHQLQPLCQGGRHALLDLDAGRGEARAKFRLSRGLTGRLADGVIPLWIGRPIAQEFVGGHVASRGDAGSPGSDGASPYRRPGAWPRRHPLGSVYQSRRNSWGVMLQAGATREAPVRTEPHPTAARVPRPGVIL